MPAIAVSQVDVWKSKFVEHALAAVLRILFLSHYFPPEVNAPANRTYEHCREWAAAGHEVHVVTGVPSHPAGKPFPGYRRGWYQHEEIDGIHVHRVWTHLAPNRGVVRRTLNYLSFVPTAVFRAWRLGPLRRHHRRPRRSSSAPWPDVLGAALRRTPWVFELRDLWPESIHAVGAMRPSLRAFGCSNGSSCASIARAQRGRLRDRRLHAESRATRRRRRRSCTTCRTASRRRSGTAGRAKPAAPGSASRRIEIAVSYIGTIGMAHGLGTVLEAARLLETIAAPRALLHRRRRRRARGARRRARPSRGQSNVAFTGLLPRGEHVRHLAASDIALVTLKPAETFKTVLPVEDVRGDGRRRADRSRGRRRGQGRSRTVGRGHSAVHRAIGGAGRGDRRACGQRESA